MKKILFVDDELFVIEGLKRMLRPLRNEWEMKFAVSGPEALKILEKESIDVIVSDMRMPGMDGAELLSIVMKKYPNVIRIILSGYSEQGLILKSVRPSHQFHSKPCNAEQLYKSINRASKLHAMMKGMEIKSIVSQMDTLPSQPALYSKIIEKLQDPGTSIHEIGQIIEEDMGMTTQVLKLINSSFFGFYKDITSPVQAVTMLGITTIKTLVLSLEVFSVLKTDEELSDLIKDVWDYSKLTAHFSRLIAQEISDNAGFIEDAFLVGFIYDIGFLILASKLPRQFKQILKRSRLEKVSVCELENEVFGATHYQIGAYLLGLWRFSDKVIEAITYFRNLAELDYEDIQVGHVLHLAAAFAHRIHKKRSDLFKYEIQDTYLRQFWTSEQREDWFNRCRQLYESGEL